MTKTFITKNKIVSRTTCADKVNKLQQSGSKVGFTSGSFDIFHSGHLEYLEEAREKCDFLVVGVNSDRSVREYKGSRRPIISEEDRIRLIAGLACVDLCFLFDEAKNAENIKTIKANRKK